MQQQRHLTNQAREQAHHAPGPISVEIVTTNRVNANTRTVNFNLKNQNSAQPKSKPQGPVQPIDKEFSFANGTVEINLQSAGMINSIQSYPSKITQESPSRNRVKFADTIEQVTTESAYSSREVKTKGTKEVMLSHREHHAIAEAQKSINKIEKKIQPATTGNQLTESKKVPVQYVQPVNKQSVQTPVNPPKGRNPHRNLFSVQTAQQHEGSQSSRSSSKVTVLSRQANYATAKQIKAPNSQTSISKLHIQEVNPHKSLCKQVYLNLKKKFTNETESSVSKNPSSLYQRSNSEATVEISYNTTLSRITSPNAKREDIFQNNDQLMSPAHGVKDYVERSQFSTPVAQKLQSNNIFSNERHKANHQKNLSNCSQLSQKQKIKIDFRQAQQVEQTPESHTPQSIKNSKRKSINEGPLIVNDYQQLNINTKKNRVEAVTKDPPKVVPVAQSGEKMFEQFLLSQRKYSMTPIQQQPFLFSSAEPYDSFQAKQQPQRENQNHLVKMNNKLISWEKNSKAEESEKVSVISRNNSVGSLGSGHFRRSRQERIRDASVRQNSVLGSNRDSTSDFMIIQNQDEDCQSKKNEPVRNICLEAPIKKDHKQVLEVKQTFLDSQTEIPQPQGQIPLPAAQNIQPDRTISVTASLDVSRQLQEQKRMSEVNNHSPYLQNTKTLENFSPKRRLTANGQSSTKSTKKTPQLQKSKSKDHLSRRQSIQQSTIVILEASSLKGSIVTKHTPLKSQSDYLSNYPNSIQPYQSEQKPLKTVISKEINLVSDGESSGEMTQSSNKEYETCNFKKNSFVGKLDLPVLKKVKRNRIIELKEQVQKDMLKGIFDMKAIRKLENEAAIIIQRFIRRRNTVMIKPLREGRNCGVQTDTEPKPQAINQKQFKDKLLYQFTLMTMAQAFYKRRTQNGSMPISSVMPSSDYELSSSIQVEVFKMRGDGGLYDSSINPGRRIPTDESEDYSDIKTHRSNYEKQKVKAPQVNSQPAWDKPRMMKKEFSTSSLQSQLIQQEQQKQSVKIEKYTSTYALNSIKKQREFHKVK